MVEKSIIEKIRRLLALAGNNPNEAERVQAMLKAQRLLEQHDLQMKDVSDDEKQAVLLDPHVKTDKWRVMLFSAVALIYDCECLGRGRGLFVLGLEGHADVTVEIAKWLMRLIWDEAKKLHKSLRTSFCIGAAFQLGEKARELKEKRDHYASKYDNQLMCIVDKNKKALDEWKEQNKIKDAPRGGKEAKLDWLAAQQGRQFGNELSLERQLVATPESKRIGVRA